ncbi:MAG: hypothetical protein QOH63_3089 [Acidobacteriota bacterium]|jgi:hypothetical protein|nr:hypothetical protein [Acidobacteriota bacterium]
MNDELKTFFLSFIVHRFLERIRFLPRAKSICIRLPLGRRSLVVEAEAR